jgi:glucose/mannose transport system substrate-binding protein
VSTDGDAFYFPKLDDPDKSAAQLRLASMMFSKEAQVAFNLKKGSMPIRTDVDLAQANACMKKGIALLKEGKIAPSTNQLLSPDTSGQIEDLMTEFWSSDSMSAEDAQKRYAEIIANAD